MDKSTKQLILQYLSMALTFGLVLSDVSPVSSQLNGRDLSKDNSGHSASSKYQQAKIVVEPGRLLPSFNQIPLTNHYQYQYGLDSAHRQLARPIIFVMDRDNERSDARNMMNRYYIDNMASPMMGAADQQQVEYATAARNPNEISSNDIQSLMRLFYAPSSIKSKYQRLTEASSSSPIESTDQQQTVDPINVQTRSLAGTSAVGSSNALTNGLGGAAFSSVPRSFISILYGRPGSGAMGGLPGIGGYNKKAEPKDNFFMHFG